MTREEAKQILPLIELFADGRQLQAQDNDGGWFDVDNPAWSERYDRYRIKPEPKPVRHVPLEASDIEPGSVIRSKDWIEYGGFATPSFFREGISWPSGGKCCFLTYKALMDGGWQIKRAGEDWQPCRKVKPE